MNFLEHTWIWGEIHSVQTNNNVGPKGQLFRGTFLVSNFLDCSQVCIQSLTIHKPIHQVASVDEHGHSPHPTYGESYRSVSTLKTPLVHLLVVLEWTYFQSSIPRNQADMWASPGQTGHELVVMQRALFGCTHLVLPWTINNGHVVPSRCFS